MWRFQTGHDNPIYKVAVLCRRWVLEPMAYRAFPCNIQIFLNSPPLGKHSSVTNIDQSWREFVLTLSLDFLGASVARIPIFAGK